MTSIATKPFPKPLYVARPLLPPLEKLSEKLQDIWSTGRLTNNGPQHKLLERKILNHLKVPYGSLFNNGTIALIVACQSLRLTGEVITTPFTFAATPHVLTWNNIKPIFCDINEKTMNIDSDKIEAMITPKTTGILAVHVFGTPCEVERIQDIANRYGLRVIYDAAHAFGVEINDVGIGSFGDISMFSFHATKLFHTAEGGALTFNDKNLKSRIDLLKNFGIMNEDEVIIPGINGKMNELQAALGLLVLDIVEEEQSKRAGVYSSYCEYFDDMDGIDYLSHEVPGVKCGNQYFIIKVDENVFGRSRDFIYEELKKYNVFARKYFYPLCSNYPCYKYLPSADPIKLPVANETANRILALPFYGDLATDDIANICKIIHASRLK